MMKFLFAAAALLALTGCHRSVHNGLRFVITPDGAAHTVTLSCRDSSSGACHFTFTHGTTQLAKANIDVGNTITLASIAPEAEYCAAPHTASLGSCKPSPLPYKRSTVTIRSERSGRISE